MNDNTINSDMTMGGGASGTLLAGRYRVVRQLGQGGMGSVWLAEDLKLDGHKVAIKMLPSILVSNKRAYNQLKSEALVALKLTHPNIATVRAFEENEGNPFLVMDYIDGLTLDEYLAKKGKLSEDTAFCLLEPVARALDYAHERGIVHRDVKPGNVMVTWDGDPYVLDFGIAREIQETMTRVTGKLSSGTLLYMSPEQLKGASPKPAQDVYSFAALAYECLKGEPPFCRGQVEWQILNDSPEPLPAGIAMGPRVMAGLAKKPEDRPPNCLAIMRGGWEPSDAGGAHAAKPKVEAGGTTSAPRAEAPKKVAPSPEAESPLMAQIRERWKLLALVGVSLLTIIALVSSRPATSSPSGRSESAGVVEADDESKPEEKPAGIDAKYVDVGVLVGRAERLARADGFAAKIDALVDVQNRARSHYELQKWSQAAKLFDEAESAAKELLELGRLREQAKDAAVKMERQARTAKEAAADRYAADRFNAAKDLIVQAKAAFDGMRFAEAAEKHGLAAREFELSVGEAKAEAVRQKNWRQKGEAFTITDNGLSLTMKWCPAGSFDMGSPEDEEGRKTNEKQHRVTLTKGFWMGETEVTQGQWKKLMDGETPVDLARKGLSEDGPVNIEGNWRRLRDHWRLAKDGDPAARAGDLADDVPGYNMTWAEACLFCRRLTDLERSEGRMPDGYEYRLPTEAEWEYACRAGATTVVPDGTEFRILGENNAPALDAYAWYGGNSSFNFNRRGVQTENWPEKQYPGGRASARTVKGRRPNAWGLYDMLGNVYELCGDLINLNEGADVTDPLGLSKGRYRVARGGSFVSRAAWCRPALRNWLDPCLRAYDTGFRVALAVRHDGYPFPETPMTETERATAETAARAYGEEVAREENALPARTRKVLELFHNGRLEAAYDAVTDDMHDNPEIQVELGWYYDSENRYANKREPVKGLKDAFHSTSNPHADDELAVRWYRKAMDAGNAQAMWLLGRKYVWGEGVPKDLRHGGELYKKSAAAGCAGGLKALGDCYWGGNVPGIPMDRPKAIECYKQAAGKGHAPAFLALAEILGGFRSDNDHGQSVPLDIQSAVTYARKASQHGNARGSFLLAKFILSGKTRETDRSVDSLLGDYAKQSTVNNMAIALMFREGHGVPVDKTRAMQWYRKAADLDWPNAYYQIGMMYKNGEGVRRNLLEANRWLKIAAEKGEKEAEAELDRQ